MDKKEAKRLAKLERKATKQALKDAKKAAKQEEKAAKLARKMQKSSKKGTRVADGRKVRASVSKRIKVDRDPSDTQVGRMVRLRGKGAEDLSCRRPPRHRRHSPPSCHYVLQ